VLRALSLVPQSSLAQLKETRRSSLVLSSTSSSFLRLKRIDIPTSSSVFSLGEKLMDVGALADYRIFSPQDMSAPLSVSNNT
jgi:hypothetical protein